MKKIYGNDDFKHLIPAMNEDLRTIQASNDEVVRIYGKAAARPQKASFLARYYFITGIANDDRVEQQARYDGLLQRQERLERIRDQLTEPEYHRARLLLQKDRIRLLREDRCSASPVAHELSERLSKSNQHEPER